MRNSTPLKKLIFTLNNGLKITGLKLNGSEVPFDRKQHLIIISNDVNLLPEQTAALEITYSGKINEALCYLDIDEETRQEKYGKSVVNVDKRYAFIKPNYVLLTPETNWYVRAGVTYSSEDVGWAHNQFVNFSLKVKTLPGLQAISQGEISKTSDGQFTFNNEHPLTQLSLAIGNYKQVKVKKDSIEYGIWYIKGHDFFSGAFDEIKDTIPSLVDEYFGDFERTYNLEYTFKRFSLVEVPAQLKSYERAWTSRQEYVQPEEVLIPEKAFMIEQADFEGMKKRMQKWGRDRGDVSPQELQMRIFGNFVRTFTEEKTRDFNGGGFGGGSFNVTQSVNPYFIFPMIYNFQNNIKSDRWPIINRIFEAYLKSQNLDMRSIFMRNMSSTGLSDDEEANIALQDHSFEEILEDPNKKDIIDEVIKLKGDALFSKVQYVAGETEFETFLNNLLQEYRFKNITFDEFDEKLKEQFNTELTPVMDNWFKEKRLPGFLFSPVTAVQVKSGEAMETMVKLKATNFSDVAGLVKLTFRLGGGGRGGFGGFGGSEDLVNKLIYLEAHQTKDISYLLESEPRNVMINTMTSKNIPQVLDENFRDIEEDPKAIPYEGQTISDIPVNLVQPGEIIVDNEDPEFEYTKNKRESLLEKWIVDSDKDTAKYEGMDYFRPPTHWTDITNTEFYGNYILSGYYIKSGDGSQVAKWHVPIKNKGYYEVYYHLYKARSFRRGRGGDRSRENGKYNFTIVCDQGDVEQALDIHDAETGWNLLGTFSFSSDTALVELSNKSEMSMVFADAVKFVKQ